MDAVMISIRPKWCAMIARGQKTIEVRKTIPKSRTPFKCYIYCTKGSGNRDRITPCNDLKKIYNGKVIGEFLCDRVELYLPSKSFHVTEGKMCISLRVAAGLSVEEVRRYAGGKPLYGWHISRLKIYDNPRELMEFHRAGETESGRLDFIPMKKAPQSWCYVESEA